MNIILFQSYETGATYHAAELEVLQNHIDSGDNVIILSCRSVHCGCDYNPTQNKLHCFTCRHQTKRGNKLLKGSYTQKYYDGFINSESIELVEKEISKLSLNAEDLRSFSYEDYDLGLAVLSTIISRTRDPNVDLDVHSLETVNLAKIGLLRYITVKKVLDKNPADLVYFFNGRHTAQRAIRRVCEARLIDFYSIEGGHNLETYSLFKNSTPHDIEARTRFLLEKWDKDPQEEREERGASFYTQRIEGHSSWGVMKSFTNNQVKGKLPNSWDSSIRNVAIYCSSEDEYVAVGEQWKCQTYENQLDGLRQISNEAKTANVKICFYLRMHPNLSGIKNDFVEAIYSLAHKHFVIINPESDISTYDLMLNCDVVVSFGSSAGIEAAYWGKPSVLLGSSFYMHLDATYNPQNHDEFVELINREKLMPKENARLAALKYSNYFLSFGIDFTHTKTEQMVTKTKFKNVYLNGSWIIRNLLQLRNKMITSTMDASVKKAQAINDKKQS